MPAPRLTTDEYLRTPETVLPQELVYGFVREAAAPTPRHQWAVGELFTALRAYMAERRTGRVWTSPIDVVLDRGRGLVVQPDLVVVLNERLHNVTDRVWGAPDLVIEVMSPRPRIGTLDERIAWFAAYGVRECWLVRQPACEIEVLRMEGGAVQRRTTFEPNEPIVSGVLPDLSASRDTLLGSG